MKSPVRKHEQLIAWQLCSQLRRLVLRYTRTGPAATDFDYRRQLRRAVRSACYNTSEGFYRYGHGEFGHSLNIARGSLGEALDQINDPQHPAAPQFQFRFGISTGNSSRSPHSFHDPTY